MGGLVWQRRVIEQNQKLFSCKLCLPEDRCNHLRWEIESTMNGDRDAQMHFHWMTKLRVTSLLMVNIKTGMKQRSEHFLWLQSRQLRHTVIRQSANVPV